MRDPANHEAKSSRIASVVPRKDIRWRDATAQGGNECASHIRLVSSQRAMLLSARKEPGKYTKGAVLGAYFQALLRIVAPPLALALAMTEPEEKAVPGMRAS